MFVFDRVFCTLFVVSVVSWTTKLIKTSDFGSCSEKGHNFPINYLTALMAVSNVTTTKKNNKTPNDAKWKKRDVTTRLCLGCCSDTPSSYHHHHNNFIIVLYFEHVHTFVNYRAVKAKPLPLSCKLFVVYFIFSFYLFHYSSNGKHGSGKITQK